MTFYLCAPIGGSGARYARHGRELVGCKSPVRKRESQGGQYTKCNSDRQSTMRRQLRKGDRPWGGSRNQSCEVVFTKTSEPARRVYVSVGRDLTRKLKLVVNRQKSRVCSTDGVEFLGFIFQGYGGQIRVSPRISASSRTGCEVFPGLGGLLWPGADQELLQRTGQVGSTSPPVLLLEAMALPTDPDHQPEEARHSGARSGYTWCQQQRPVGVVRQPGSARSRPTLCVGARGGLPHGSRTGESLRSLEHACSLEANRLVLEQA